MLHKILHKIILPCSKATFLMEKKNSNSLTKLENYQLCIHLKICKWCNTYNKKIIFIDDLIKINFKKNEESTRLNDAQLNEFKKRITEKLNL